MSKKIEARIDEGDIKWTKEIGYPAKLEGEILIGFECQKCYATNQIKETLTDHDGTSRVYECESCKEPYLITIESTNPITPKIGDKENVELYRKMIPTLKKIRGNAPRDAANLKQQ